MKSFLKSVSMVALIFLFAATAGAEDIWTKYKCNDLPHVEISSFMEREDNTLASVKIIDDPDISQNKLLRFSSPGEDGKYRWTIGLASDVIQNATIIFRAKGINPSQYARAFEIQYGNGEFREKLIGASDNNISLEMAKSTVEQDTGEWHIYRWVIAQKGEGIISTVYIDENPTPVIDKAISTSDTGKKFLEFGDSSGSYEYGLLLDWLIWTTNGAFSPKQEPLPKELTGISKTKVMLNPN